MKYSTFVMGVALAFDLLVDVILLIVGLVVRASSLMYDAYLLTGVTLFLLIGMGVALGLTIGGYRRSMFVVSLVFNVVFGGLLIYSWLTSSIDITSVASGLIMVIVNIALTAVAYSRFESPKSIPMPLLGI
ncbi:MAG: hypothetical protein ACP5HK_00055 [Acidilobus sp.]